MSFSSNLSPARANLTGDGRAAPERKQLRAPPRPGAARTAARGLLLAAAFALAPSALASRADAPPLDVGMVYIEPELRPARAFLADDEVRANPIETGLRKGLADYRKRWGDLPQIALPAGATLRHGDSGIRVRLLRQRLGLDSGDVFDRELGRAVRDYRRAHGLGDAQEADDATIASLNRGFDHYERLIRINLERARALPGDPGRRFAVVDAAAASLLLYEDGRLEEEIRVIVGKEEHPTPMLAGMIRYAVLNPYWNVPPDLVRDRIAPAVIAEGPRYLSARRYQILSDWTADARVLRPDEVDWKKVASGKKELRVRQLPGPGNGMGEIKFMFPNRFGVYLHDTPDRTLFREEVRRFSAGCVRVEEPWKLAKWLFGDAPKPSDDRHEERVDLPEPVPVFITYLTAAPGEDGIVFRADAYGRDAPLLAALDRRDDRRGAGGRERVARR